MKTTDELNEKWWYRLVKVIYFLSFCLVIFPAVLAPYFLIPKELDLDKSVLKCSNGRTLNSEEFSISSSYISYDDSIKIKFECLDTDSGLNTDEIEIINFAKDNGKSKDEATQAIQKYRLERFKAENISMMQDNYTFIKVYKETNWAQIFLLTVSLVLSVFLFFEFLRRCFYYIVLGRIRPNKT